MDYADKLDFMDDDCDIEGFPIEDEVVKDDIEKAIETQQKLIKKWELRAQHLKETIDKFPWGRDGLQYDFGDWRESELKRRKQQIEIASITISALQRQLNNGWIPVSERLPDNNTKVQVTGVRYSEYTKKNIYVRFNAKYIGKHSIKVDDMWSYCEDYTWNDYVEEEDEYYVKEGWYETIENWDDYTEVYVNDYKVIEWQPLPEPWKEA